MVDILTGLFGWEALFENLEGALFFKKDLNSKFTGANQHFLKLCGVSSQKEILGKNDHSFFPDHLAVGFIEDDKKVMNSKIPLVKKLEVNLSPSGVVWLETTKVPLFNAEGIVAGLAGLARDMRRDIDILHPIDDLRPALEHIELHLGQSLPISTLAEMAGISLSQFERKFKRFFAMSPKQYILKLRLEGVRRSLTESQHSLAQLAYTFGFHDQSHMSRQFKRQYGLSPKRFSIEQRTHSKN
jgi:AraC-like DNA-binding protein